MEVKHCLVQAIGLRNDEMTGVSKSVLYTFRTARWVSIHPGTKGGALDGSPVTMLSDGYAPEMTGDPEEKPFGERKLPTTWGAEIEVSLRDAWTVPPWTLYVLVLPPLFVAKPKTVKVADGQGVECELRLGRPHQGCLFYYRLFEWAENRHAFEIKTLLVRNPVSFETASEEAEVVKGLSEFQSFMRNILTEKKLELLLKAVPIMKKLVGG